jgi:hypothetical protein
MDVGNEHLQVIGWFIFGITTAINIAHSALPPLRDRQLTR